VRCTPFRNFVLHIPTDASEINRDCVPKRRGMLTREFSQPINVVFVKHFETTGTTRLPLQDHPGVVYRPPTCAPSDI